MLAPNSSYSISSLAALREVNALTSPMTKTQAESVLASFVAKGWLLKSKYVRPLPQSANLLTPLTLLLLQKGSFLVVSTLSARAPTLPQVYVSGRSPGMQELLRGGFQDFSAKAKQDLSAGDDRSLHVVMRAPRADVKYECTTLVTKRIAEPMVINAPTAARTGADLGTTRSCLLARLPPQKTNGHAVHEEA